MRSWHWRRRAAAWGCWGLRAWSELSRNHRWRCLSESCWTRRQRPQLHQVVMTHVPCSGILRRGMIRLTWLARRGIVRIHRRARKQWNISGQSCGSILAPDFRIIVLGPSAVDPVGLATSGSGAGPACVRLRCLRCRDLDVRGLDFCRLGAGVKVTVRAN